MIETGHRFGTLGERTCRERLESGTIGRVGWTTGDGPQVLPVTYVVHDDQIVFRTSERGPLGHLEGGEPVVFEVDEFDPTTRNGWSVVVRGRAFATQRSPRADQLWREADPVPWAAGERPLFVSISLDRLSGRFVARHPDDED